LTTFLIIGLPSIALTATIVYELVTSPRGKRMDLRKLQTTLPWTIKYSQDFRSNPMSHKDFAHGLTHVTKASGRLSEIVDKMDHSKEFAANMTQDQKVLVGNYISDLVVCALRMANTFPGGTIDLQDAVVRRIETKNGVKL